MNSPAASPSTHIPTPITGLHWGAHAWGKTAVMGTKPWQPEPLNLPVKYGIDPDSTLCMIPPLHVCLQLASATTQEPAIGPPVKPMHIIGSSHHRCLTWALASGPGGASEDPEDPCSYYRDSAVLFNSCQCCGPQLPQSKRHRAPPDPVLPHLMPCTTSPRVKTCSRMADL